jgi:hypothetical protein
MRIPKILTKFGTGNGTYFFGHIFGHENGHERQITVGNCGSLIEEKKPKNLDTRRLSAI